MANHELKTRPVYFEEVRTGVKTFEFRRDDRGFEVGDVLVLREWITVGDVLMGREWTEPGYTGRVVQRKVTSILRTYDGLGVPPGFVVMSIGPMLESELATEMAAKLGAGTPFPEVFEELERIERAAVNGESIRKTIIDSFDFGIRWARDTIFGLKETTVATEV